MKIKKITALFVVLSMVLTQMAFVVTTGADNSYTLAYSYNSGTNSLTVTGFTQTAGITETYDVVIPDTADYDIDGNGSISDDEKAIPVTVIGPGAFCGSSDGSTLIKSITIGSNVTTIGAASNTVEIFENLPYLTELTVPDNVTAVLGRIFYKLAALKTVTFGANVTSLNYYAFTLCPKLETININASTFNLANGCLYVNTAVTVNMPNCTSLTISSTAVKATSTGSVNFKVANSTVYSTLSSGGFTVGYDVSDGREIVIASSDGTYSLKFTTSAGNVILNGFASEPTELVDLVIPSTITDPVTGLSLTVVATEQSAFKAANIKSAVVPGTIETFGTRLFESCADLQTVELQEGITYLNFYMFYSCTSLTELVIPASVTSVDFKSMQGASNLATVRILGENVTFTNNILSGRAVGGTTFYVKNDTVKAAVEACADNTNATYFNKAVLIGDETEEPEVPDTDVEIAADTQVYESKWAYDAWNVGGLDTLDTLYYARKDGSATISVDREDLASTDISNLPAYVTNASLDIVCKNKFLFANGGEEINLDIEFNDNYTGSRQLDNMLVMLDRTEDKNANGNMTASGTFTINLSYSTVNAPETFISVYSTTKSVTQYYTYLSMKNISNIADVDTLRLSVTYSGSKFSICEIDVNMKDDPYTATRTKAQTEITPVKLISDGMVMQRNVKNTVWGTGGIEGETLTVKIGNQTKTTTVTDGKWSVEIDPVEAGGPYTMEITCGTKSKTISDIWFGEVWLASGQSNMARSFETLLGEIDGRDVYYDIDKTKLKAKIQSAVDNASDTNTRYFTVSTTATSVPYYNVRSNKNWQSVNSTSVLDMSAVCYYFAQEMRAKFGEDMPIGMVIAPVSGSPLQGWVSNELLASDPDYAKYDANWTDAMHYNSMIYPITDYNFKGILWYQGESNVSDRVNHKKLFPQMIDLWRSHFGENIPFIFTQLAPYTSDEDYSRELFREAQLEAMLNVPNTAMAVITDSGDPYNIHPMDKSQVGKRLAAAADALAYGGTGEYSGPLYKSMRVSENKLILSFDHIGSGLAIGTDWGEDVGLIIGGDSLVGFEISEDGTNFVEAEAVISGNTVVVSADGVDNPVAVRYGWNVDRYSESDTIIRDTVIPTLYNNEGFPAVPFRAYADGFTFDVEYTDGENAVIKIDYTNKNTMNSIFFVAVYYDGKLVNKKILPAKFDYDGAEFSTTYNLDLSSYENDSKLNIKVFALDGLNSIKPLAECWNMATKN